MSPPPDNAPAPPPAPSQDAAAGPAPARAGLLARLAISPAHMRLALRAAVAGVVAYALASALELPKGYWTVFTAILVVQSSLGASLSAAFDRTLGTIAGAAIGAGLGWAVGPSEPLTYAALAFGVAATTVIAARNPSYRLAPVTVGIVLIADPTHAEPLLSGMQRVAEIALGCVVGMVCALAILPERALGYLFPHAASALKGCATLIEIGGAGLLGRSQDDAEVDAIAVKVRAALRAADARAAETKAERASFLVSHADPAPVVRACRRIWHSCVILLRARATPLPPVLADLVRPALDAAVAAVAADLRATAAALETGAPFADQLASAPVDRLAEQVDALIASGRLDREPGTALTVLFGARAALGQMRDQLDDLRALAAALREAPAPAAQA